MSYFKIKISIAYFILASIQILGQNKFLEILNPINGQEIQSNNEIYINWYTLNINSVKIEYSVDNKESWIMISQDIPSKKSYYKWLVPKSISGNISIKISEINDNTVKSISNIVNVFVTDKILVKPLLKTNIQLNKYENPIKIMPLGNSITRGITGSDENIGYRRKLYLALINAGYNVDFVGTKSDGLLDDFDKDHEGHSGWHAKHPTDPQQSIADNIYSWLLINNPDIILMHVGSNDINDMEFYNDNVANTVNDVNLILDTIDTFEESFNKNIIVILAQVINRVDDPTTTIVKENDSTSLFDEKLKVLANDRIKSGDKILLVNQESALNYPDDLYDGLHPNQVGYDKMADVWYSALDKILTDTIKIVDQTKNRGVILGDSVQFSITATSKLPLFYQWLKNGEEILGANDSVYFIDNPTMMDDSTLFSCRISNILDTVVTNEAYLFVTDSTLRISDGEILRYELNEEQGNVIHDSQNNPQVNLEIYLPESVKWIPYGLEIDTTSFIYSNSDMSKIYYSIKKNNELSLEIWLKNKNVDETGSARIFTISKDENQRDFSLFQNHSSYEIRLRNSESDNNGLPSILSTENSADTLLTHFVFTRASTGINKIYIDSTLNFSDTSSGDFANWDSTYQISLANEFVKDNPWKGNIYSISLYNRELSEKEVKHNYSLSIEKNLEIPRPSNLAGNIINDSGYVVLSWVDNSANESGFIIENRALSSDSLFQIVDTVNSNETLFQDTTQKGTDIYEYRIYAFNSYGISGSSNIIKLDIISNISNSEIINEYKLYQNFPNPFNPITKIKYSIPNTSQVNISVYNILGQKVEQLVNSVKTKGLYYVKFNASSFSSGVYFYKIDAKSLNRLKSYTSIKKLVVLK